ncbi:MAG: hypothetical protein M1820_006656 [Bogoriella megaspora]|nr:MAG: hypothetical protein M1820_006656 [Bogoriella megaspora]
MRQAHSSHQHACERDLRMAPYEGPVHPRNLPDASSSQVPFNQSPSIPDPSRLAPEDAAYGYSEPRRLRQRSPLGMPNGALGNGATAKGPSSGRRKREKDRGRSSSGRRKGTWKKLLWVKQSCERLASYGSFGIITNVRFVIDPDNYTDEETFLDHLQRNPRLQPYEFWPLVADTTVIVQHVCSVLIFICCFVGIYQERISPVTVVGFGSTCTVLGWICWDHWVGQEEAARARSELNAEFAEDASTGSSNSSATREPPHRENQPRGSAITTAVEREPYNASRNASSLGVNSATLTPVGTGHPTGAASFAAYSYYPPYGGTATSISPRNQQRLATAKSAILIYCALLGLSPIMRSLTKSTTSDSIWAMSTWLMFLNVFFFDYGGGPGAKFPASLSTNAAIMASTVLASRLPSTPSTTSTTHVFSLTLFSIEVFGLFPVFRRHLRHISWRGHVALTCALIMGEGAGVGLIFPGAGLGAAIAGIVICLLLTSLAMGICSWWLIGLQKYKNEIHGPWDPARPIIRRHWD